MGSSSLGADRDEAKALVLGRGHLGELQRTSDEEATATIRAVAVMAETEAQSEPENVVRTCFLGEVDMPK
ncbi:hypothetical protein KFU94_27145 [Chloroflexi bacterium TSY]|nr:hypothetical protein [Chloroflexi bacterium TSY]